jgi:hypothetical protein
VTEEKKPRVVIVGPTDPTTRQTLQAMIDEADWDLTTMWVDPPAGDDDRWMRQFSDDHVILSKDDMITRFKDLVSTLNGPHATLTVIDSLSSTLDSSPGFPPDDQGNIVFELQPPDPGTGLTSVAVSQRVSNNPLKQIRPKLRRAERTRVRYWLKRNHAVRQAYQDQPMEMIKHLLPQASLIPIPPDRIEAYCAEIGRKHPHLTPWEADAAGATDPTNDVAHPTSH